MNRCMRLSRLGTQPFCRVPLAFCFGLRNCSVSIGKANYKSTTTENDEILHHSMPYEHEMYIGYCGWAIKPEKLTDIASQCSQDCNIQLFRKKRSLLITSQSEDDITKATSLINENLIQVCEILHL